LVSLLFLGFLKELRKNTKMPVTSGVPCTGLFWSKQTIELVRFDKSYHTVTLITLYPRSLVVLSLATMVAYGIADLPRLFLDTAVTTRALKYSPHSSLPPSQI
jgi:hypothetical protein